MTANRLQADPGQKELVNQSQLEAALKVSGASRDRQGQDAGQGNAAFLSGGEAGWPQSGH